MLYHVGVHGVAIIKGSSKNRTTHNIPSRCRRVDGKIRDGRPKVMVNMTHRIGSKEKILPKQHSQVYKVFSPIAKDASI